MIKNVYSILFCTGLSILMAGVGCKKNDYVINADKNLAYAALSKGGFVEAEVFEKNGFQDIDLSLAVTTRDVLKKDFHATIDVDPSVLEEYNTKFNKTYKMLPSEVYKINGTSVIIPAGSHTTLIPIQITTELLDDTKEYVLPVRITAADGLPIAKNFGWVILKFIKFKYEGVWKATGKRRNFNADGSETGPSDIKSPDHDKTLTKVSADTYNVNRIANLGVDRPGSLFQIKIAPDNKVQISGYLDAPGNLIVNEPGTESVFNPKTREFTLNYRYTNANGSYRVMNEIWKK